MKSGRVVQTGVSSSWGLKRGGWGGGGVGGVPALRM